MKKRILFCVPDNSAYRGPISRALTSLGYQVQTFDYRKGGFITRTAGFIKNQIGLNSKLINSNIQQFIQHNLLKKVEQFKPDLLLVVKGETITRNTISKIRKKGIAAINWYPDWLICWDWIKENAPYYSLFLTLCLDLYQKVKKITPSIYLPPAAEPDKHLSKLKKKYPIVFIGQHTPRRERFFKKLIDLGLRIWGYEAWQKSSLRHISKPAIKPEQALVILRQSKIVVNILTGSDNFQPNSINNRTLETLGVGSFLLVHDHPLLHQHFQVGKELVTFSHPNDLYKKAKYYLQHEQEREKIAKAGWQRVKRDYTYEKHLKKILADFPL